MAKQKKKFELSKIGNIIDDIAKKIPIIHKTVDSEAPRISTGIYILNASMSGSIWGGIKADAITAFAGPEASGKSFLALNACREAQKIGYIIVYIDTENAISLSGLPAYGINNDPEHFRLITSNNVENINMTITQLLDDMKQAKDDDYDIPKMFFVLDSLAQLASTKEKEDLKSGKQKQDMTKAKAIGSMFRSITMDLAYLEYPLIVNNQTYQTMDLYPQEVMKGGRSLYYSASNITFLSKAKLKTGDEDDNEMQSGIIVTAKAFKNRQAVPKKVKFHINFSKGCNPYVGLDMFCNEDTFDTVGIAKGKWIDHPTPIEIADEETGEITTEYGKLKPGGHRWYIKHLGKSVFTKELFSSKIFTQEVLEAIEPIANAYFQYNSLSEIEDAHKEVEEEYTDFDLDDMDDTILE